MNDLIPIDYKVAWIYHANNWSYATGFAVAGGVGIHFCDDHYRSDTFRMRKPGSGWIHWNDDDWHESAMPKGSTNRNHERHSPDDGIPLKWLSSTLICTVCRRFMRNDPAESTVIDNIRELNDSVWRKTSAGNGRMVHDENDKWFLSINTKFYDWPRLFHIPKEWQDHFSSMLSGTPYKLGICDDCNPRKALKLSRDQFSKAWNNPVRQYHSRMDKDRTTPTVAETLANCWPSYRKLMDKYSRKESVKNDRIVKRWIKANPQKVISDQVRNWFKINLGISNIQKYITQCKS